MISVREIIPNDAAAYWQLRQQIDRETEFLRFEPDDWLVTTQHVRGRIELMLATDNQTIFVAENGDQLLGFLWAGGGLYRHNHHKVHVILGVRQAHAGQEKMGFQIEGTAPYALCLDGKYIDLHYMSKVLT